MIFQNLLTLFSLHMVLVCTLHDLILNECSMEFWECLVYRVIPVSREFYLNFKFGIDCSVHLSFCPYDMIVCYDTLMKVYFRSLSWKSFRRSNEKIYWTKEGYRTVFCHHLKISWIMQNLWLFVNKCFGCLLDVYVLRRWRWVLLT